MGMFKTRCFCKQIENLCYHFKMLWELRKHSGCNFGERLHSPLFKNKRFGELSGFLETLFFFKSHAASTIRTNVDIYFMVECHIATCPDDHMAV